MKFLIAVISGILLSVPLESRSGGGDFDLERIQTVHGRIYHGIHILGADTHGLTFRHREGIAKIEFSSLSGNVRLLYEVTDELSDPGSEEIDRSEPTAEASGARDSGAGSLVLTIRHRVVLRPPAAFAAGYDPRSAGPHWPASWSRYHPAHSLTIPCYRERTVRDFLFLSGLSGGICRHPRPAYGMPGLLSPFLRDF